MVAADHTNYNIPSSSVMKVWPFFFCSSANFFSLRRLCYKSVNSALIYKFPYDLLDMDYTCMYPSKSCTYEMYIIYYWSGIKIL